MSLEEIVSPRLRAFLSKAETFPVLRSRDEIVRALRAARLPIAEAFLQFQQRYAGYGWYLSEGGPALSLQFSSVAPIASKHLEPLRPHLVSIGAALGTATSDGVYLHEDGTVYTLFGETHASVEHYLERAVLMWSSPWENPVQMQIHPALGARIATLLDLRECSYAVDAFEQWWSNDTTVLRHFREGSRCDAACVAWMLVPSIAIARETLHALCSFEKNVAAEIGPLLGVQRGAAVTSAVVEEARARWDAQSDTFSLPLRSMWNDVRGRNWFVREQDRWVLHAIVTNEDGSSREWYTVEENTAIGRWISSQA